MDLSKLIGRKQEQPGQKTPQLSKEEYAARKKSERENVWARVDAQAEAVFGDGGAMKGFLDFMAQCTPQSTRNLLILYEQNPEITHPRTFEKWKEAGRSIHSGETGYLFFADQEYTREDGTAAQGYVLTRAFDISQTRGPQPVPPRRYEPEELLAAMIEQSPVFLELSDQLPLGVQAQYIPKQKAVYVRSDMDAAEAFCAIAREQAHAGFDTVGRGYYRQAFAAQAYCAAYVAARKFSVDTSVFQFDRVCEVCRELGPQEKRKFISDVKSAAYSINRDIRRGFQDLEQAAAVEDFPIQAAESPKAAKKKAEPESER